MEDVLDDGTQYDGLQITAESKMYLAETAKWAKFLAILGFIFTGLMVFAGIAAGAFMGSMISGMPGEMSDVWGGGMIRYLSLFYVLIGLLYFFPSYYLLKFANQTKAALTNNDSHTLTEALKNHKSVYKFMGIFMIVILALYALGILFAVVGAAAF